MPTPTLPHTAIRTLPDRQRQDFDSVALMELASSIRQHGLFHALLVRPDGHTLVSGERRLRAIREHIFPLGGVVRYNGEILPPGHLPVIVANSSDPLALEEIELAENMQRKDLTWQEVAATTARLHKLRQAQLDAAQAARGEEPIVHPVAATAKEVRGSSEGWYQDETRKEILVAQHMDKPEVAKAPDLASAFKALKKIEDAERNRALAAAIGETYTTGQHRVLNANCLAQLEEWGRLVDGPRFDVILTDPPYGMGAHEFGDAGGKMTGIDHVYDDSYEAWLKLMNGPHGWCNLSHQVAKPEAHAYVFCDIDRFHELKLMMESAGWYVFRTPLTNYKRNSGRVPLPDQGPRRQSEWCLYAIKGKKKVNMIASDVITTDSDEQLTHGAQKPVALYVELLRRSVKPGDEVLDSFGGTGTLLPAAHEFKCRATVIEQNPTYYGICLQRLADMGRQQELPS